MSDLYLGVLLVVGVMTLIFFGPEFGKYVSRRIRRSRRRVARSRVAFRKAMRVSSRKVCLTRSLAHS